MEGILDYSDDEDIVVPQAVCMVCNKNPKSYKCPACGILSCSLRCCIDHKARTGCTGRRNRVDYVPMSEYKEKNLINDYHFLEDVLQTKTNGQRIVHAAGGSTAP
jgi:hypothetical protein